MRQGSMADFLVKIPTLTQKKEQSPVQALQEGKQEPNPIRNQAELQHFQQICQEDELELEKMEQEERELLQEEAQSQMLGIRKSSRLQAKEKESDGSVSSGNDQFLEDSDIYVPIDNDDDQSDYEPGRKTKKKKKTQISSKREKSHRSQLIGLQMDDSWTGGEEPLNSTVLMNAPISIKQLRKLKQELEDEKFRIEEQYFAVQCANTENQYVKTRIEQASWFTPPYCIPVNANVKRMNLKQFGRQVKSVKGKLFDIITMDPPWELSSAQPTRGVAIGYNTMSDDDIKKMDVPSLQQAGFIFIWVINAKYQLGLRLIQHWGYKFCTVLNWIKQTKTGGIAKGHGFYLQHAKESCLVGVKNRDKISVDVLSDNGIDVIFSRRQGQSQKPQDIYKVIQKIMPDALCLEIFGRRNNLRNFWVTIGNEI